MKCTPLLFSVAAAGALLLAGCGTPIPPGAERGPHDTMAYEVSVEASSPARIEVNGDNVGKAPVRIKIFGDPDGTFHDFGSYHYIVRAFPLTSNAFVQTRIYRTGRMLTPQDHIPQRIWFQMNEAAPTFATPPPSVYYGPPPVYADPYPYYPYNPYWGSSFHFGFGSGWHGYHRHW